MGCRSKCAWLGVIGFVVRCALAGGGPPNVLVIVNDNSPVSMELGQYYQDLRGLPERNLVHVRTTTNYTTGLAAFTNEVVHPVRSYLAASGLSNQIDYLVLTRDLPYRVYDGVSTYNGASAVLFYGFKPDGPPCSLTPAAFQDYYDTESAFSHQDGPSSNRYYLSTILTGYTLDRARSSLDRAVAADATFPTGQVALLHTSDNFRSVRWTQFDEALFSGLFVDRGVRTVPYDADALFGVSNLVGYLTGVTVEPFLGSLGFVPGALADHLTSYGGCLFDTNLFTPFGQMPVLDWLQQGAAGSYGTVVEPCAYPAKFPHALVHHRYQRGFNLAESYAMSVRAPYMGVTVGDPLTAPYACEPVVSVTGLSDGQVTSNDLALTLQAYTTGTAGRVSRLDVFLDGFWQGTVTNLAPTTGNQVSLTINGTTRTATVQTGDTLEQVASRLVEAINDPPPTFAYAARAYGDRIQVIQETPGVSGAWIQVSAASATGSADRLTVFARSVFSNLVESPVPAKEGLLLAGTPVSGDVVRVVVTRLDGAVFTNEAAATTNDATGFLLARLRDAIHADTNLATSLGCYAAWPTYFFTTNELWLVARTNGWRGRSLHVTYSIHTNAGSTLQTALGFSDVFNDNDDVLAARATVFLTEGTTNLQAGYVLAVTNLPDGPHEVEVVAYEGSAVRTQGRLRIPFVVDRHALTCAITNPPGGRYLPRAGAVTTEVAAVSPGTVTQVVLRVEGKDVATNGAAPCQFVWPGTNYGAGVVGLQAQAWDDGGRSTVSEVVPVWLYTDDDADSLPDQWEYRALGSATNGNAAGNPDGDAADNLAEFLADTDPRDGASEPEVRFIGTDPTPVIGFPVSSNRRFAVEANDGSLPGDAWVTTTNLSAGTGVVFWADAATNGLRFYRTRATLP